jgi:hypothetical protein
MPLSRSAETRTGPERSVLRPDPRVRFRAKAVFQMVEAERQLVREFTVVLQPDINLEDLALSSRRPLAVADV